MKLARTLLAAATLFVLTVPSFAQEKGPQERDRMKSNQTSITGCLTKGDAADTWILVDASGMKTIVTSTSDLSKNADTIVKLTGAPSEDGRTFSASNVEKVADTCPAK